MPTSTTVKTLRFVGPGLLLIPFLLAGCRGISPTRMTPTDVKTNQHAQIDQAVRIVAVTGWKKPGFFDPQSCITNDKLRAGLVSTLEQSQLFRAVHTDGASDLDLKANIVSQGPTKTSFEHGGIEFRYQIVISYQFVERNSGAVVWHDTYQSEFGSTTFAGATRLRRACEGSVRENFTLLLHGIAERWPPKAT